MPGKVIIGKEYELEEDVKLYSFDSDGSGPVEIATGPFALLKHAILSEFLIYRSITNFYYYNREDGTEQGGRHFHLSVFPFFKNPDFVYGFSVLYSVFSHIFRKFFTLNNSFRNTFLDWNKYLLGFRSENYYFCSLNSRNHSLTMELRASEGPVTLDIVNLILTLYFVSIINKTYNITEFEKFFDDLNEIPPEDNLNYTVEIPKSLFEKIKDIISFAVTKVEEIGYTVYIEFSEIKEWFDKKEIYNYVKKYFSPEDHYILHSILDHLEYYAENNKTRKYLFESILNSVVNKAKKRDWTIASWYFLRAIFYIQSYKSSFIVPREFINNLKKLQWYRNYKEEEIKQAIEYLEDPFHKRFEFKDFIKYIKRLEKKKGNKKKK